MSKLTKTLKNNLMLTWLALTLSFSILSKEQDIDASISVQVQGSGQPVLLIPGLMSDSRVWQDTAKTLTADFELHLVSIAGFAGAPAGKNISIRKIQQDLSNYLHQHELKNVTVIGHSMGAFLGYQLAITDTNRISKVIAVDGLPFLTPIFTRTNETKVEDATPYALRIKSQYQLMNNEQLAAMTKQGIFVQAKSKKHQEAIIEMARQSDPSTVGNIMHDLMTTDLRDKLKKLPTPMLILGASGAFNSDEQHDFAESLYRSQFANMDNVQLLMNRNSRHFIMFDDLPWLLTQIKQFI